MNRGFQGGAEQAALARTERERNHDENKRVGQIRDTSEPNLPGDLEYGRRRGLGAGG